MSHAIRTHLRSNVVGYAALFLALTSPAWGRAVLEPDSVGSRQIRDGQVKREDIGTSQVRSDHIRNRQVAAEDIGRLDGLNLADDAAIAFGPRGARLSGHFPDVQLDGGLVTTGSIASGLAPARVLISPAGNISLLGSSGNGRLELFESDATGSPGADAAWLFARDNGAGKTQLVAAAGGSEAVLVTAP